MKFVEGLTVNYKDISGVIAFISDQYVSILISKGEHRVQDVKVVVYRRDFDLIEILGEK